MSVTSLIESLDVSTGERQILHEDESLLEAPNWSPDGSFLVYNSGGLLYRFDLASKQIELIPTGFADQCNNDHGISPDGANLVVSHHCPTSDGESVLYTLPLHGGEPKRVTAKYPSYWHGWSPDGQFLVYVAGRESHQSFKIYRVSSFGGEETQLTFGPGLDDGPEYSADGSSIYFNSFRSGRMQIWCMNADGTQPRQVVHSEHSDWFPHPSPDGSSLVFLRYLEDQGEAHPFGRDVQLMLLNLNTGDLRQLTDVFFGGQGTINVPSWSPDSQRIAFISYKK